jgi:hypothetical protein
MRVYINIPYKFHDKIIKWPSKYHETIPLTHRLLNKPEAHYVDAAPGPGRNGGDYLAQNS